MKFKSSEVRKKYFFTLAYTKKSVTFKTLQHIMKFTLFPQLSNEVYEKSIHFFVNKKTGDLKTNRCFQIWYKFYFVFFIDKRFLNIPEYTIKI